MMFKLAAKPKQWISLSAPLTACTRGDQLVDATVALKAASCCA